MTENDLNPETENDDMVEQDDEKVDDSVAENDAAVVLDAVPETQGEGMDEWERTSVAEAVAANEIMPDDDRSVSSLGSDPLGSDPLGNDALDNDWQIGDIDAALAAVASLSEMMPEGEAEAEARADAVRPMPSFVPEMPMPPLTTLHRGQLGSVVPALLLIGIGAWLTLVTTTGNAPDPALVAAVIFGGVVLSLLAQWIGTGRWSRGAVFFAVLVLLIAGVFAVSLQPDGINLAQGYPLLVVALGLAVLLSGVIARPTNGRLIAPGVLLIVAGAVGLVVTLGLISTDVLTGIAPLLPVVLAVVVIIGLLPLVFRRR